MLGITAIAVSLMAFFWEFLLVGRKRLGYRVQMDTPVTGEIESVFPGVLPQLRPDGGAAAPDLHDLSVVLVRIENSGRSNIDASDYAAPDHDPVGLHIHFPDRRVIGMAVNELSDDALGDSLRPGSGIGAREDGPHRVGIIDLPKVPLNRKDHYKILAILQRTGGTGDAPAPAVRVKIKGGRVAETTSNTGLSRRVLALICFLAAVVTVQFVMALNTDTTRAETDCVAGTLTLVGSTAFEPAVREAANSYRKHCEQANFTFEFDGSERGLARVDADGKGDPGLLAVTDGSKGSGFPNLKPRTLALSAFTMIVHPGITLPDLSVQQLRDLYAGRVANWSQLGGPDQAVRVVHRSLGSGSRDAFRARIFGDEQPPALPTDLCRHIAQQNPPGPAFCEAAVTKDMLKAVAELPGAIGYSEYSDAAKASGVKTITLGGHGATREEVLARAYPFWSVEYAYSYGELPADSLAAAFLRYLTDKAGKDVLRSYGNTPCGELSDPTSCTPGR
ncbi:substrate-binding domain-containing protein [Nocardia yamanashiensis]|uniref:substrate-binding domain-containing protein n=1 Tax=Nocardia yamanashiensis TaxID=209247 RepID=UPI001E32FD00|nr:substrate-binding domain-containing protein [Nocardia yamanashiensis]UGT42087.1 substrate-binding domain-containing protein [Nocardia yamanashiensis]